MGSIEEFLIENDFSLLRIQNDENESQTFEKQVKTGIIQFHFNVKGNGKFLFNNGSYELNLLEEKSLLLYNPQRELPLHLELSPKSWVVSVLISIKKFHAYYFRQKPMQFRF